GLGVPQNRAEAIRLYTLSAEQGDAIACDNLAEMYADAHSGTPDVKLAYFWLAVAGHMPLLDSQPVSPELEQGLRNMISPEEGRGIEARAADWAQKHQFSTTGQGELIA